MTANMQDTTGIHPLAGLLKSASSPQSVDRVRGGESGKVFEEVLDALGADVPVAEAEVDQEDGTLLSLTAEEETEGDELEAVLPDDWSNAIEDVDEPLEIPAVSVASFPSEAPRDRSKTVNSRDFGVSMTAHTDSELVVTPSLPPNMRMIAQPGETLADRSVVQSFEGKVDPTEWVPVTDAGLNTNSEFPKVDVLDEIPSRVVVKRGVDIDLHEPVGEGDPITAKKPSPELSESLTDASGLAKREIDPSVVDIIERTEVRRSMISPLPQIQSAAEMRLLGPTNNTTIGGFVAQQVSRHVGASISLEETVDIDSPSGPEVEFDLAHDKTPANTTPPQVNSLPWQNTSVALEDGQNAVAFDLGGASLGNLERGYGEISKLDVAPTNGGAPTLSSAATALHASQQIARVAQSQPGAPVELALNPEELGRVKLTFASHDNTLVVTIVGERSDTIDLMRRHIDSLSQEFKNIGYSSVSFSFSQSENGGSSGQRGGHGDLGNDGEEAGGEAGRLELSTDAKAQVVLGRAGLDIRI